MHEKRTRIMIFPAVFGLVYNFKILHYLNAVSSAGELIDVPLEVVMS